MLRNRRRLAQLAVVIGGMALLVYATSTPLLTVLGNRLVRSDPLERVDAMVVLAPSLDRVIEAAELYRDGYAPVIVLTREPPALGEQMLGKVVGSRSKAAMPLGAECYMASGFLSAIVFLDGFVYSTADEASRFAQWARGHSVRRVMVVTSPSHTARSRLAFRRALANTDVEVRVRASQLGRFRGDSWWRSRDTLKEGLYEWQGLIYYWMFVEPGRAPAVALALAR